MKRRAIVKHGLFSSSVTIDKWLVIKFFRLFHHKRAANALKLLELLKNEQGN